MEYAFTKGSTTIELVTAAAGDTLTASYALGSVSAGVRVDSESQFQIFCDYNPHADNVGNASVYAMVKLVYSIQPSDTAAASITWKTYTEEYTSSETPGAGGTRVSEFLIKEWKISAADTAAEDRDPVFSVPLGVKRVNLKVKEVGMGTKFGAIIAHIGHQPI